MSAKRIPSQARNHESQVLEIHPDHPQADDDPEALSEATFREQAGRFQAVVALRAAVAAEANPATGRRWTAKALARAKAELATIESHYESMFAEYEMAFGEAAAVRLRERVEGGTGPAELVGETANRQQSKALEAAYRVLLENYMMLAATRREAEALGRIEEKSKYDLSRIAELERALEQRTRQYERGYPVYIKIFGEEEVRALRRRVELVGEEGANTQEPPARAAQAVVVEHISGQADGYGPGHPWYYKLGGKPIPAEQIQPPAQEYPETSIESGYKLPRKSPDKRATLLRLALRKEQEELEREIARYRELVAKGWDAINDPPYMWNKDQPGSSSALDGALALAYNHISGRRSRIRTIEKMLGPHDYQAQPQQDVRRVESEQASRAPKGTEAVGEALAHQDAVPGKAKRTRAEILKASWEKEVNVMLRSRAKHLGELVGAASAGWKIDRPAWLSSEAARRVWDKNPGYRVAALAADRFQVAQRNEVIRRAEQFAPEDASEAVLNKMFGEKGIACGCDHHGCQSKAQLNGDALRHCFKCDHLVRFTVRGWAARCEQA